MIAAIAGLVTFVALLFGDYHIAVAVSSLFETHDVQVIAGIATAFFLVAPTIWITSIVTLFVYELTSKK